MNYRLWTDCFGFSSRFLSFWCICRIYFAISTKLSENMERSHFSPGECWALVIWASTPPLLRRTARNMRYWLAGYLPCCLDIYYHRHIMVLQALVMMVLSGSKYYAGNLIATINILKDKTQFPSIGWDVKYKCYKRKVQWCNVMVCTDLIGYSTEAPNSQSLIMQ